MRIIEPNVHISLDVYGAFAHLRSSVAALRADAEQCVRGLRGRTVWMINSTPSGGGVAEVLPTHISLLRQLGIDARWGVLETEQDGFFAFTKRLHNLIHAEPGALPNEAERTLYESVNTIEAKALAQLVRPGDVLVVHDPQPLPLGAHLKARGLHVIWRCHIGVDETTAGTTAVWEFLRRYAQAYDLSVFSLPDYIPTYLRDHAIVIHPSIDPLSHKNRELSLHKLVGIMCDAGLVQPHWPLVAPPFQQPARRVQADGTLAPATTPEDLGLLTRPIVTQISRWDRLKGFAPLLDAFVLMKTRHHNSATAGERAARKLDHARLVLAGPDPASIPDDPEAQAVFAELTSKYRALAAELQRDIAIIALPMASRKENALMVNTLQRASDVIVQNSLREGFGLTVAEAMWKRVAVLGSAAACGVRLQVRDGLDGRLVSNPEDVSALAGTLGEMLCERHRLDEYGRNGQYRAHDEFLIFSELRRWLHAFSQVVAR
jgi:trehalose synthase